MKERPIIFTGNNPRLILEGKKTQTRRLIRFPLNTVHHGKLLGDWGLSRIVDYSDGILHYEVQTKVDDFEREWVRCPYGRKGDRLWVREGWKTHSAYDPCSPVQIDSGADILWTADGKKRPNGPEEWGKARSPIFMPRWASRILLELLEDPIPQRLHEITEEDATAEGIPDCIQAPGWPCVGCQNWEQLCRIGYKGLWESIHGNGAWEINPWVFKLSFKVVKP